MYVTICSTVLRWYVLWWFWVTYVHFIPTISIIWRNIFDKRQWKTSSFPMKLRQNWWIWWKWINWGKKIKCPKIMRKCSKLYFFSLKTSGKHPFLFPRHSQTKSWIKLKPTYVEAQGPQCFGKVPFVTFGTANWENTGDIHRVSHGGIKVTRIIE